MNKKQETNPNNNPISKQEKKLKKRKWIIVSTIFGISSVVIFAVTFTNMAKSIAINNEMKETVKKNRELIDKLKSDADLDAKDKLSKIQTFTKMRSNTVSANNLKNFIVKKTPIAFHDDAYNETINLAKTDLNGFIKKYNVEIKNNFELKELKKRIDSLDYKTNNTAILHTNNVAPNVLNTIVQKVNVAYWQRLSVEVIEVLTDLVSNLSGTSETLTTLSSSLGITGGVISAILTILGPLTFGATIAPAVIIASVFGVVITALSEFVNILNSTVASIQTITNSMINVNTSRIIANLPLNLEKQINNLKKQLARIEPHWAIVGIPDAIREIKNAITELTKLYESTKLLNAVKKLSSESYNNINDWMINNKKPESPTKIVYINQSERLRTVSVGATTGHKDEKLTYQWYSNTTDSTVNGKPISGATSASYKITPADVSSSPITKYFYVIISGSINGAPLLPVTSKTTSLIVNALPVINVSNQATAQNVSVNQKTNLPTFSVVAATSSDNENAKLTYQWFLVAENHQPAKIAGATNASYQVTAEDTKNIGLKYFYAVVNGTINGVPLTPITSDVNSLMVDNQPENLKTTLNKIVYLNQTQDLPTFSVKASVSGNWDVKFSYQWYKNNINSTIGGTAIEGVTSSSYSIQESDVGLSPTKKYFYVIVGGTINDVELVPVTSQAYSLTTKTIPIINKNTVLILQN